MFKTKDQFVGGFTYYLSDKENQVVEDFLKLIESKSIYFLTSKIPLLLELSKVLTDERIQYDPSFGDDKECNCGHAYYRHFDTYANMESVGCKYCSYEDCTGFKLKEI